MKRLTQREINALIELHERFLHSNGHEGRLLTLVGRDLSGLDLRCRQLRRACFKACKCIDTAFAYSALCGADFRFADVSGADFSASNLIGADFSCAKLERTKFDRHQIIYTKYTGIIAV